MSTKTSVVCLLSFAAVLFFGCGSEQQEPEVPAQAPVAAKPTSVTEGPDGGIRVLTSEDMEKLQQDRKEQIDRSTPLNEEHDQVEELRKRMTDD